MRTKKRFHATNSRSAADRTAANESERAALATQIRHRKMCPARGAVGALAGRLLMAVTLMAALVPSNCSIDCFKCVSYNGANKACDDPFHNNYSTAILESPCMGGRKGRDGLFPATACIKIAGYYDDTGETITVRGCALDSGTLTTDTELIRMSHCGEFYFDDRYVHGCLQSCSDADACNGGPPTTLRRSNASMSLPLLLLLWWWWPARATTMATTLSASLSSWWWRCARLR